MRLEKVIKFGSDGRELKLRLNIYNITNVNTVRSVTMRSGPAFNRPTAIVQPRIAEIIIGYRF